MPESVSAPSGAQKPEPAPADETVLYGAIDRLTGAMLKAADDEIPGLVAERAAMRDELRSIQHARAGNVVSMTKSSK
jgi:hypothetical protein